MGTVHTQDFNDYHLGLNLLYFEKIAAGKAQVVSDIGFYRRRKLYIRQHGACYRS